MGALAFGLSRLGRRPLFRVALGTSVLARRRRAGHGGRRGGRLPAYRARCDRLRRARLACPRVYGRAMADGARRRTDSRGAPGAGRGRRPRHRGRIAGQRRPRYRRRTRDRSARGRRNPEDGSYQAGWTPTAPGPRDADKGPCRALAAVAAGGARRVRFPKTVFLQWAGRVRVLHGIGAPRGGGFERRCAPKTRPVAANGVSARDRRPRRSRRSHRRGADDGNARRHPGVPHGCDSGFRDRPPARHIGASYRLGGRNPLFQHTRQPRPDSALGASPAHQEVGCRRRQRGRVRLRRLRRRHGSDAARVPHDRSRPRGRASRPSRAHHAPRRMGGRRHSRLSAGKPAGGKLPALVRGRRRADRRLRGDPGAAHVYGPRFIVVGAPRAAVFGRRRVDHHRRRGGDRAVRALSTSIGLRRRVWPRTSSPFRSPRCG